MLCVGSHVLHQSDHAGAYGGLGELHLTDVLLRDDYAGAAYIISGGYITVFFHIIGIDHDGESIEYARSAQTLGRGIAYHLICHSIAVHTDGAYGSGSGRHTTGEPRTLKCRTCGSGTACETSVLGYDHLAVRPDIRHELSASVRHI